MSVWLIERGQAMGQTPTVWWTGAEPPNAWTEDVNHAAGYTTREEAEAEIEGRSGFPIPSHGGPFGIATEHVFAAALPGDRHAQVAGIAAAIRTSRLPSDSPDAGDRYWATLSDDEIASDLYDAALRSTSRDSEVREAIEALRHSELVPENTMYHEGYNAAIDVTVDAVLSILDRSSEADDEMHVEPPTPATWSDEALRRIGRSSEAAPTHDRATCDHECHTDPDMDEDSCDGCTGTSEQERAESSEAAPTPKDYDRQYPAGCPDLPASEAAPVVGLSEAEIERVIREYLTPLNVIGPTHTPNGYEWPARCTDCGLVTEDPDAYAGEDEEVTPEKVCPITGTWHAWANTADGLIRFFYPADLAARLTQTRTLGEAGANDD